MRQCDEIQRGNDKILRIFFNGNLINKVTLYTFSPAPLLVIAVLTQKRDVEGVEATL